MIIRRYLIKETVKMQLAILLILFMIFMSQKLIKILSNAVDGSISIDLIFPLLLLGSANILQLILPLSLFLAVFFTFSRLYAESEIIAMYACTIKKSMLHKTVFILSLLTCTLALLNYELFTPWSSEKEIELTQKSKTNFNYANLLTGQFQKLPNGNGVVYIGEAKNNAISKIFIATKNIQNNLSPSIIIADKGQIISDELGNQIVALDTAKLYENASQARSYRIADFHNYQTIIKEKQAEDKQNTDTEKMSISQLLLNKTQSKKAEFYWRLSILLSIFLMPLLVIPFTELNPRAAAMSKFLPVGIIYLMYFLLQSNVRAQASKNNIDPMIWFFIINSLLILITLIVNRWSNNFIHKIKNKSLKLRRI